MSIPLLQEAFARTEFARELGGRIPGRGALLRVGGLAGSSGAATVAWLAEQLPGRMQVVVATSPGEAERWLSDLQHLMGEGLALYPQREALGEEEPHYEIAGERIETLEALLSGRLRVLVTTARATAERTAIPVALAARRLVLEMHKGRGGGAGGRVTMARAVTLLEEMGYSRVPSVTEVAEFSVRGGIVDVYGFGMAQPARAEWWGDDLLSLRGFDLTTQRSLETLDRIVVLPIKAAEVGAGGPPDGKMERRTLLELLPPDALVIEESAGPNREEVERAWRESEHHLEIARRLGEETPTRDLLFEPPAPWRSRLEALPRITLRDEPVELQAGFLPSEKIDRDLNRLRSLLHGDPPALILCDNQGQRERLDELLQEGSRTPLKVTLSIGALDGGFVMRTLRVLTDHEIFRRARRLRRPRRYRQAAPSAATGTLVAGDYVVHLDHGIGIYRGIQTIQVDEATIEVMILEYEGGDRLNVPLYRIDQVERYRAAGGDDDQPPPRLHRLGGTSWQKTRERTRTAIHQMAAELLDLYARRQVARGFAFPPDTRWQRELESAFLYEDTPDQRKATEDIKRGMEDARPMDRLLVGDVGYGKTEVAVRAAFKAVQGGKQVAVLVPTTLLADQHGRTFTERLADFPVKVAVLSRFQTVKEQKEIVARVGRGEIDVVIGTHRLLSKDVLFKDLGLLVVDEEHRFGVKHKERLKELRLEVDVLTLTATPIPRTLHLSLAGLRDLTLIETPPR
ncbi:MAG: DEAD/DEAH box helicase, partial [Gemmatimonadota bacterium]